MLTNISIALVAALHVLFLVLEMFLWKKPFGRKPDRRPRRQPGTLQRLSRRRPVLGIAERCGWQEHCYLLSGLRDRGWRVRGTHRQSFHPVDTGTPGGRCTGTCVAAGLKENHLPRSAGQAPAKSSFTSSLFMQ